MAAEDFFSESVEKVDTIDIVRRSKCPEILSSEKGETIQARNVVRVIEQASAQLVFDLFSRKNDIGAASLDGLCERKRVFLQDVKQFAATLAQLNEGRAEHQQRDREGARNDVPGLNIGEKSQGRSVFIVSL